MIENELNLNQIIVDSIQLLPPKDHKSEEFIYFLDSLTFFAKNLLREQKDPNSYFMRQFELLSDDLKKSLKEFNLSDYEKIPEFIRLHNNFVRELRNLTETKDKKEVNSDCARCPSFDKVNNICAKENERCNCDKPELLKFVNNSKLLAICKNCGHVLIKVQNSFLHHRKTYQCGTPYVDIKCGSPKGYEHSFIVDKNVKEKAKEDNQQGLNFVPNMH